MNEEVEKDYIQLVAAQNEAKRRLKIKSINNTLSEEKKKKSMYAAATGICFSGVLAATYFSGIDAHEVIELIKVEIQALSSFDALKAYFAAFTPAMWGTAIATAGSLSKYINHNKKYKKANQEFNDIVDTSPEYYLGVVENQAKSK